MLDFVSIAFTFLALCGVQCRAQQNCDYYSTSNCLNVEASGSVNLPFPSLFKEPPSFVYGIDQLSADDVKTIATRPRPYGNFYPFPPSLNGKDGIAVGWWLEYDNSTLAFSDESRHYYVFALETYEGGKAEGSENGCEGLLGSDCATNLKSYLKTTPINNYGFIKVLLENLAERPLHNLSCPRDIWGAEGQSGFEKAAFGNLLPVDYFVHDVQSQTPLLSDSSTYKSAQPPGNASSMHIDQALRANTFDKQKSAGVVAVAMSWPSASENTTMDTVEVNIACLQVGGGSGSGGSSSSGDKDNGAAVVRHTVWHIVVVAIFTFMFVNFLPSM